MKTTKRTHARKRKPLFSSRMKRDRRLVAKFARMAKRYSYLRSSMKRLRKTLLRDFKLDPFVVRYSMPFNFQRDADYLIKNACQ